MADSDDDVPLSELRSRKLKEVNNGSSDSDNELTLADVMKKIQKKMKKKAKKGIASETKVPKRKRIPSKSSGSKTTKRQKTSAALVNDKSSGPPTAKHALVEQILRRWPYCLPEWPSADTPLSPPHGYIACGFKGLFVCVQNEALGKILDRRERQNGRPPIQSVLLNLETTELKNLLEAGLQRQRQDLLNHQSDDTVSAFNATLEALDKEIGAASKLKEKKMDKEYSLFARRK